MDYEEIIKQQKESIEILPAHIIKGIEKNYAELIRSHIQNVKDQKNELSRSS